MSLCRTQKRFRHDSRLAARSRLSDSFSARRIHTRASRGYQGGASAALTTEMATSTVKHAVKAPRRVRSCSLATGGTASCSAAAARLITVCRTAPSGRSASTGAKSDSSLRILKDSSTPWAPRSDLHHRSGRGAFERLRAASPEVGTGCRIDGRWRRSAAHSRADSERRTTACIIV